MDHVSSDPSYKRMLDRAGPVSLAMASQYVNNLYKGVKKFASRPFDFICFTNESLKVEEAIELRQFPLHTRRGVLPRVYMFSEEAKLENRQVLCLDLDVIIVGSLKRIMAYEGPFCARSKFKRGEEWKLDGDIMSFKASKETSDLFWAPFIKNVKQAEIVTQGRERYWIRHIANDFADRWDSIAPGAVLSYKRHMAGKKVLPERATIISCHGFPRPHQVYDNWLKELWLKPEL